MCLRYPLHSCMCWRWITLTWLSWTLRRLSFLKVVIMNLTKIILGPGVYTRDWSLSWPMLECYSFCCLLYVLYYVFVGMFCCFLSAYEAGSLTFCCLVLLCNEWLKVKSKLYFDLCLVNLMFDLLNENFKRIGKSRPGFLYEIYWQKCVWEKLF